MTPYTAMTGAERAAILEADPAAWFLHRHYAGDPPLTRAERIVLVRLDTIHRSIPDRLRRLASRLRLEELLAAIGRPPTTIGIAATVARLAHSVTRHGPPALRSREVSHRVT